MAAIPTPSTASSITAIRYGRRFRDDTHVAGPITISIDLTASVLSVFRGGDEIETANVGDRVIITNKGALTG